MMTCQYKHKYIFKDKPMKPQTWLAGKNKILWSQFN